MTKVSDIKPVTAVRRLKQTDFQRSKLTFSVDEVSELVGMSPTFIRKVLPSTTRVSAEQLLALLEQDAFSETYVPRSRILSYLTQQNTKSAAKKIPLTGSASMILEGDAHQLIDQLPEESINCVVTSPPYWGTRLYDKMHSVEWADGDVCPYGHEQTPEAYVRHTIELLVKLKRVLTIDGSIWWNIMDTFNTRTQIRSNAVEALRAMQGKDKKTWGEHACRRYSAGHAFLKDGEQCGIPLQIAVRASKIGLFLKGMITWSKTGTTPEPQNSRVSRNLEYIIHLSRHRTPKFDRDAYKKTSPMLGGRGSFESEKLGDVWYLSTSSGRDGHGAQFALALPGRCIALSTLLGDVVLDPFAGGGTSGVAAAYLERKFVGFDISSKYVAASKAIVASASNRRSGPQSSLKF